MREARGTDAFGAGCLPLALGIVLSVAWGVLAMPRWLKIALAVVAALLIALAGLSVWSCVGKHRVQTQTTQADQHHQAAAVAAAKGEAQDQVAERQGVKVQSDASEVSRLRAELARLREPKPVPPQDPAGPPAPDPQPVTPPVDLAPIVAKQDELIKALDLQVYDQAQQIKTLTLARDSWRLGAQESAKEALQLRAALAAQEGLTKAALWKGRIQGLMIGAGAGYVGGRIQR